MVHQVLNFFYPAVSLSLQKQNNMPRDLISRYVWIVDTLKRYRTLTRQQISDLWQRSSSGDGRPIPERTFYHYRRAIEQNFNITIGCNSRGEYFIDSDSKQSGNFSNWLLDSMAVNSALTGVQGAGDRIEVEDVPSARTWLSPVLEAISNSFRISFTYAGFNRSRPEKDIMFRPYFLKRYKQRWYMAGLKEKSGDIRTYALDRVSDLTLTHTSFTPPETLTADDIFGNIIGVTSSKGEIRNVRLQTSTTQAKYFRALPLHSSQTEEVHDLYSIFSYRLKLNWELVHDILGYGPEVKVLEPHELKLMVVSELRKALGLYGLSDQETDTQQPTV